MGNKHTAEEAIDKILTKKNITIEYFRKSKIEYNYMELLAVKLKFQEIL